MNPIPPATERLTGWNSGVIDHAHEAGRAQRSSSAVRPGRRAGTAPTSPEQTGGTGSTGAHPTPVGRLNTKRNGGSLKSGTVALRERNMQVWGLIIIAFDVLVIWTLSVHGRDFICRLIDGQHDRSNDTDKGAKPAMVSMVNRTIDRLGKPASTSTPTRVPLPSEPLHELPRRPGHTLLARYADQDLVVPVLDGQLSLPCRGTDAGELGQQLHLQVDGSRRDPRNAPRTSALVRVRPSGGRGRLTCHQRADGSRVSRNTQSTSMYPPDNAWRPSVVCLISPDR